MSIQKTPQIILAILVSSFFLFQNCATITMSGTSQTVPITSNPSGAKIIVNGKERGYAPLNLKLKKYMSNIIRIEKPGYNPLEIRISRKSSLLFKSISGNILWGPIGSIVAHSLVIGWLNLGLDSPGNITSEGEWRTRILVLGFVVGWASAVGIDIATGATYSLSPKELNLRLIKIEGKTKPDFILINAEQFKNIKWIRIKCADSDREDEIVNLD
ncbi:MAG: PEGA domain-containing protein [Candidatus Aminicenantaceae bacterium]